MTTIFRSIIFYPAVFVHCYFGLVFDSVIFYFLPKLTSPASVPVCSPHFSVCSDKLNEDHQRRGFCFTRFHHLHLVAPIDFPRWPTNRLFLFIPSRVLSWQPVSLWVTCHTVHFFVTIYFFCFTQLIFLKKCTTILENLLFSN